MDKSIEYSFPSYTRPIILWKITVNWIRWRLATHSMATHKHKQSKPCQNHSRSIQTNMMPRSGHFRKLFHLTMDRISHESSAVQQHRWHMISSICGLDQCGCRKQRIKNEKKNSTDSSLKWYHVCLFVSFLFVYGFEFVKCFASELIWFYVRAKSSVQSVNKQWLLLLVIVVTVLRTQIIIIIWYSLSIHSVSSRV